MYYYANSHLNILKILFHALKNKNKSRVKIKQELINYYNTLFYKTPTPRRI